MARAFVILFVIAACTSDDQPTGEAVFSNPVADGNTFACATCHAVEEPDVLIRAGHPIGDAANRTSFKNGRIDNLRGAVNSCLEEWMAAKPWTEDDARWQALRGWLESLAPAGPAPAIESRVVAPPVALDGGNVDAGRALFNKSCIACHGTDGAGTVRGPRVNGLGLARDFVARRIRTSGSADSPTYEGLTGGRMPFFAADRLTDAQVIDLAAYVNASAAPTGGGMTGGGNNGQARECASTHAKIGQTATLSTRAHGVRGAARIVDDCTIAIENFSYDGGGIDVRVYAGTNGDYDGGYAISHNFVGMPYTNGTLTVQLPVGKSLDDLDGVSIWCVAASFSFGDGRFQ